MEITEDSLVIAGPRRRGRPRVEEPRASVSTWIPSRLHDELAKQALRHGVSVSAIVRLCVTMQLRKGER